MTTTIIQAIVLLLVLSIVFPVWMIYRKTRARAELIIAIGWSILAFIRLGILLGWSIIDDASSEWVIINTMLFAVGYWWLWFSSKDIFSVLKKDKDDLESFRADEAQVTEDRATLEECKDEIESFRNGDNNAS